ncbi:MAG: hypothetical protein KatS3mg014_0194 [Actinomycetota bacterium]|nr:MAG: hypothetical protein KatS3mg014_0194 [Actinomycetota bacterium]
MDGAVIVGILVGAALGALAAWAVVRARREAGTAGGDLSRLEALLQGRLEAQAAELRRLADAGVAKDADVEALRRELGEARGTLERLVTQAAERAERERESWQVVQRLSTVLAGGATKGRAGENVLAELLRELPPGMLVTDLKVGGKTVEFALELPDGRRLPVDSKWSAVGPLEALEATDDPAEREALIREIERGVRDRVREVAQYLDPAVTAPVAVAAVPDAAYAVLRKAHAEAFRAGVVVVPYSVALPVILFLYSLVVRFGRAGEAEEALREIWQVLDTLESILENRVEKAARMLRNAADEVRAQLGKARGSIARGGAAAELGDERPPLEALP